MEQKNNNKFINHTDPTLPINLSSVSLEEQYAKLTDQEKLMVAARALGMDHIPVSIKQFVCDDFYLGSELLFNQGKSVFPYWFPKLDEIFPTPITTKYPFVSLGGCVK